MEPVTLTAAAAAGVLYGLARCIRETFDGRSKLIRAKRGDPEPGRERVTLLDLLRSRGDP